jgi:hypothetical protein
LASCLHFVPIVFCSEPFFPVATSESKKVKNDGQHLYDKGLKLPIRNSRNLQDRPPLQMRTVTHNDEAAPWSRRNHVLGTRSLPSNDDCDINFSGTLLRTLGLR